MLIEEFYLEDMLKRAFEQSFGVSLFENAQQKLRNICRCAVKEKTLLVITKFYFGEIIQAHKVLRYCDETHF